MSKLKDMLAQLWMSLNKNVHKLYRGLLCEKKDGEWELSKGNAAFWVVFAHCMYVWSHSVGKAMAVVTEVADSAAPEAASLLDTVMNMSGGGSVQGQEFWLLTMLLGYATVKQTKGGLANLATAIRGK